MPRSGNGTFIPVSGSWNPAVGGTTISSTDWAALLSDLASGLTTSIAVDGQTPTTASIPFAQGLTSSMPVGIGMTPVNVLDVTQNQNNTSIIKLLNSSAGAAAQAFFQVSNGTHIGYFYINGPSFTPSGIDLADGVVLKSTGAGGLTLSGSPIYGVGLLDISNASSGQIKFPSTQNASADANTLDDYQDALAWTPSLGGSATYTARTGRIVKVGSLVFFQCSITINAVGTGSQTQISGLPYSATNTVKSLSVGFFSGIATSVTSLMAYIPASGNTIRFSCLTAAATSATDQPNVFQNGTQIEVSGCYNV